MIALPSEYWVGFQSLPLTELVEVLLQLTHHVKLSQFKKHRRGPKKPPPKRYQFPKQLPENQMQFFDKLPLFRQDSGARHNQDT